MSAGLFTVTCPECGVELELDELGHGLCNNCGHSYLSRFGHLIPEPLHGVSEITPHAAVPPTR